MELEPVKSMILSVLFLSLNVWVCLVQGVDLCGLAILCHSVRAAMLWIFLPGVTRRHCRHFLSEMQVGYIHCAFSPRPDF